MRKLLTFLWLLIIGGLIFIAIQYFKPDSHPNNVDLTVEETDRQETPTTETEIETEIETEDLSFSEHLSKGDTQMQNQEFDAAIGNYIAAVNLNPRSLDAVIKLGEAYLANNQPAKAEQVFRQAQEIDENSIIVQLGLARSRLNQRDYQGAKEIIWQMDITIPEVKYYTAIILVLGDDPAGAKNLFETIFKTQNISQSLKTKSEKFLQAFETFSYFSEGSPLYRKTLLGKALVDVGEYDSAIPLLFQVIEEKNNYRDAWVVLGYAYLNTGKTADAIDALNQARILDTEKPETLFFLGLAYFTNNEIDRAIQYLEQADKAGFEPKEQIDLKLGDLYLLKNDFQAAARNYEELLAQNSSNLGVYVRTVWLNIDKLQNSKKALSLSYRALEFYPDDAMSYNLVGWSLTANGSYDEAKKFLTKALELKPNFDAANLNFGWLYEKQGATTLAKEYYKKAYLTGKDNSIAELATQRYNNLTQEL